ncbi:MAG: sugar ABC transporter permease [Rhodobacteraceae bacterium]|nr:sugar ABC transporter permease [Paracoccaceae bacterium]
MTSAPVPVRVARRLSERRLAILFVAPALLLLAVTLVWPLILALDLSVRDVRFIGQSGDFVGLANYADTLNSTRFWESAGRSLIWVVGNAVVQTALALAAALILHQRFPGVQIARVWILLTWIVPTVVVVIIWRWLLSNSGGMINPLLVQSGVINAPVGFFASRESAMTTLILINAWRWFPFVTLMILAALTRIPADLDEAARMDGAGRWKRFSRITWPLLQPTLAVLLVVGTLLSFNVFDIIWLITAGGPSAGTQTLPVLIYETAFRGYEMSQAAAMSVLTGLFLMVFAVMASRGMSREAGP